MSLSQAVAGRSRNVNTARVFFPVPVNSATPDEFSPQPPASPYAWKRVLHERIWSMEDGPKGITARGVLTVLLGSSDAHGRTWVAVRTVAKKAGLGNVRTVRLALDQLVRGGWLRVAPQTWSSLTAEQKAVGRKAPRRGDLGQAPNLYVVLDGRGHLVTPDVEISSGVRPGLARSTVQAPDTATSGGEGQICPWGEEQICPGGPGANLPPDPDPVRNVSRMESEGRQPRPNQGTPHFSQAQGSRGEWGWLDAWNAVVHVHTEKTKAVYGVAPLPPDLKRDDRQAVAECLDGAAVELAAKLRARGMERELVQVRQDLAGRVMALYFKRDNEHLRRVKHALRDLPREFHARIIEAMQGILRESHDEAKSPRQTVVLEEPAQSPKVEKAAEVTKIEAAEKPMPQTMPANTAREARRIMEALNAAPSREEPSNPRKVEPSRATRPTQEAAGTEPQQLQEADHGANASQTVQRSMGRPGAPRWGALGPTPAKVRRVSRPAPEGPGEGGEPSSTE